MLENGKKLLPVRITECADGPDDSSQSKVYSYIKTRPGTYISKMVDETGLNRGVVKYQIKILKAQNKIEAYKEDRKTRYFVSDMTCDGEEKKVMSALQNPSNQRIISEIRALNCNTNVALARELGVSKATISWHIQNLKDIGLIKETKEGRRRFYRINSFYKDLIAKYG